MDGHFRKLLREFDRWRRKKGLAVLCAQEHNLDPKREADLRRAATAKNIEAIFAFAPPAADGVHRGGALILVDRAQLDIRGSSETFDGLVRAVVSWGGLGFSVASVYVPVDAARRVEYLTDISTRINSDTFSGGDYNCVPDVTLDVHSRNPLNYPNQGVAKLAEEMAELSLADERRSQLQDKREYTRVGNSKNGWVGTRIDRWYTPTTGGMKDMLLEFGITNQFCFKKQASDHYGVWVTVENQHGKLGHDRQTIREDLVMERAVQEGILQAARKEFNAVGSAAKKWTRAMGGVRDYLMSETAKRRKKDAKEIARLEGMLGVLAKRIAKYGPTERVVTTERRLQKELYELRHPEMKDLPSDTQAYNMYTRSEVTTRAQFSPYKEQSKQQWINEVHQANWVEDEEPVFEGKTQHTKEVAGEFVKYYRMLLDDKHIDEGCARILLRRLAKKKY